MSAIRRLTGKKGSAEGTFTYVWRESPEGDTWRSLALFRDGSARCYGCNALECAHIESAKALVASEAAKP